MMITMEGICKSYRIAKRNAGLKEACKSLFYRKAETIEALSDISFTIADGEMVGYIGYIVSVIVSFDRINFFYQLKRIDNGNIPP